jgi:hypothetical protein
MDLPEEWVVFQVEDNTTATPVYSIMATTRWSSSLCSATLDVLVGYGSLWMGRLPSKRQ